MPREVTESAHQAPIANCANIPAARTNESHPQVMLSMASARSARLPIFSAIAILRLASRYIIGIVAAATTNAVKYGALSRPDGRVKISWHRHLRRLEVEWMERGGPAPSLTPGKGFGTRLLQVGLKPFNGSVDVRFAPTGLVCRISLTLPEESGPAPLDFVEDVAERRTIRRSRAAADRHSAAPSPRVPLAGRRGDRVGRRHRRCRKSR
jgi:hypothetical protein